jgi:phosphoribosylformimino-5-aminoimidazole carboxamide ribonucleotide (ProFAR) isomerase
VTPAIDGIRKKFGRDSVIVALDNKKAKLWLKGGKRKPRLYIDDALDKYTQLGVHRFLITSIAQDGMLNGPDMQTLSSATLFANTKIIAAGGIGTIGDLAALKKSG